jgi:hypothetical protein
MITHRIISPKGEIMKNRFVVAFILAGLAPITFVAPVAASNEAVRAPFRSGDLVSDSIREVRSTMIFFEGWWRGDVEKTPEEYRLSEQNLLTANFSFVTPEGMTLDRNASLTGLYEQHGSRPDLVKIEDVNFKVILADSRSVILSYDELQTVRDSKTGNLVTTVLVTTSIFERSPNAPNGVAWVRVQETTRD